MKKFLPLLSLFLFLNASHVAAGTVYPVTAGEDAQQQTAAALGAMGHGDTLKFGPGIYHFTTPISMDRLKGITIVGAGRDSTILSFAKSGSPDGILLTGMTGVKIEDLTIIDTPGFAITVSKSSHIEMRRIRVMWSSADGTTDLSNPESLNPMCVPNIAQLGTPDNTRRKFGKIDSEYEGARGFVPPGTPLDGLRDLLKQPAYTISPPYIGKSTNGAYAIYPVQSSHITLDDVHAFGAADAGIYVGQSNNVIIKNSIARYNVAGYEIENTDSADMHDNLAECNTAGLLIFDLPGLAQYGEKTRMYDNISQYNNLYNFAVPGVVADVPAGIGLLILGYDRMEIHDNLIQHHRTVGVVAASHELLNGGNSGDGKTTPGIRGTTDLRMDLYPEGMFIYNNEFINNGYLPQEPEIDVLGFDKNGDPTINDGHSSLLPALIMIKSMTNPDPEHGNLPVPQGAHIVWDGMFEKAPFSANKDEPLDIKNNPICGFPDFDSHVLSNRADLGQGYTRDAFGKPDYINRPELKCRFNAYKFQHWNDGSGKPNGTWIGNESLSDPVPETFTRNMPRFGLCIGDGNTYTPGVPPFMNFQDTDPAGGASFDMTPHKCELPLLPDPVVETFADVDAGVGTVTDPAEVTRICEQDTGNSINYEALQYNCPKLSHYNLFAEGDPRNGATRGGILYDLTTPLFSDYAKKYRIVFVPTCDKPSDCKTKGSDKPKKGNSGKSGKGAVGTDESSPSGKPAGWRIGSESEPNVTIDFPVGTVIAKTFTFPNGADENIVETRLLIHRGSDGDSLWKGLPYVWRGDDAELDFDGEQGIRAQWNYTDKHTGKPTVGSTDRYLVPSAGQCLECHSNQDHVPGSSPIGVKVRLLNMPNAAGKNQLQEWIDAGILDGPQEPLSVNGAGIATNAPRLPRFDNPGDDFRNIGANYTKFAKGETGQDVQARARAWLETNCAHCHNDKGRAGSTGLLLDVYRHVNLQYGVCKHPPAGGSGLGGYEVDILPKNAGESIIPFRIRNTTAGEQMPPIGRSVAHTESIKLIESWINQVVDESYPGASGDPNRTCN